MSVAWDFVARFTRTRMGRVEREYLMRAYGRVIRRRWKLVIKIAEEESEKLTAKLILAAGALAKRAAELYPRFAKKYPFVAKLTQQEWAEAVARLINRGEKEHLKAIRGVIVERFVPSMKEMTKLYDDMVKLAKANGWGEPALVSGVRTPNGKELADWMIVAEHKDGRVWIMALIESKSISNTSDLVFHGEKPVGQHMWDIFRAKSDGIKIERFEKGALKAKTYGQGKVVVGMPGSNVKETTRLIGVTPRDFTPGEIKKLVAKGLPLPERWAWPVDEQQLFKMLSELVDAVSM